MLDTLYARGSWKLCEGGCRAADSDWGADALTFAIHLRWSTSGDASLVTVLAALSAGAPTYGPCLGLACTAWSDVPEWDAIASAREYDATRNPAALSRAIAAYQSVERSNVYALGACPHVRYQIPFGGGGGLKTLETDSNAIKAALLLWKATGDPVYLAQAENRYAAVRSYFLDPDVPLYTVYLYDDGKTCKQLPGRFFGSVNGNQIWNGLMLAQATGQRHYADEAEQTAAAIAASLADARGIFADLQAENDVVEPLVEGMLALATQDRSAAARAWILDNAAAAARNARAVNGLYGRFFDGPPPSAAITAWQTSGGSALAIAAASLDPQGVPAQDPGWAGAQFQVQPVEQLPSSVQFTGSGVAVIGTLGAHCCEEGHATVSIDGQPTFDQTGIWQNKSSAGRPFPAALLFSWRWPTAGVHTLSFGPGVANTKEGGPFLHIDGLLVLP